MEFDEDKAVAFIQDQLAANGHKVYDHDDILNVIDIIWDYYDETGLTGFDIDDDTAGDADDIASITAHVRKILAKDKGNRIEPEDLETIITAEIEYENSII